MSDSLQLTVNGEPRQLPAGSTVADLVAALGDELGWAAPQVAVERNKEVVRRAEHAATALADGDQLEVVTFFGGG